MICLEAYFPAKLCFNYALKLTMAQRQMLSIFKVITLWLSSL